MRWLSLLLVLALFAAACSDDDAAAPSDPDPQAASESSAAETTTTTLRPPTPTDPPEREPATIGSLEIPCTPADGVALPERPGVTDDGISIGTGSDRGGIATPGAGNGIIDMIEALADHCNAQGGMYGRDLRVVEYDAAAVEAGGRIAEACVEVAAMVGYAFLQRVETALAGGECGLPLYPAGRDLVPTSPFGLHGHLLALFADPANAASVVLVGPDTPLAALDRAERRAAIGLSGGVLAVVGEVVYPIDAQPNWELIVGAARAVGGGQIHIDGGCDHAVLPFVDIAERAGWTPVVVATAAAYEEACLLVAQADRLLVEIPFLPYEDGDDAPATTAHAALLDQIAAPHTGNAILAATEFWRWATAAQSCLAETDDGCLGAAAAEQDGWTAGGLHPPIAADGSSGGCAVVLGIESGEYVRRLPLEPGTYDCAPERSVLLPSLV